MQRELHVDAGLDQCLSRLSTPSVLGCFLSSYRDSSLAYGLKPRVLGHSLACCLELGASINEFHLLFIFIFFILKKMVWKCFPTSTQPEDSRKIQNSYLCSSCNLNSVFLSWIFLVFKKIILFHPWFMTTKFYFTIFKQSELNLIKKY